MVTKSQENKLKKKARSISISEGIFASAKTSFGTRFLQPFAIAINSSNSIVASLTGITGLLGPIIQTFSSKMIEKTPRKKIVLKSVLLESLAWIPFIIIALFYAKGIVPKILPIAMLLFFSIYIILRDFSNPAWFSWMGDIVEEKNRGEWFSKRDLIMGFVGAIIAIGASLFLDCLQKKGNSMLGFSILFVLAFVARLRSYYLFKKQYEPNIKLKKGDYFSFREFVIKSPKTNFGQLSIYRALLSFSVAVTSSLLAIYLIRILQFSYLQYILITLFGTLLALFTLKIWGKIADRYGSYRTLCVASIILPIVPILWTLNNSFWYLISVPSLMSGIGWAGLHLSEKNFIYDNVSPKKRGLAISYYNVFWGIGTFLGSMLSATLIKYLSIKIVTPIIIIFFIGAILRMIAVFFWLPKMKEIKPKKSFKSSKVLEEMIFKNSRPVILEEMHEIIHIKKYLHA